MNPIAPIRLPGPIEPLGKAAGPQGGGQGGDFASALSNAIRSVSDMQTSASSRTERFLNGEPEELHQVALEQQKAALSFELFLQMRNKVVQAYQEIMRMPL
jgi:flagellar hook-basal body complex protein FliE